MECLRCAWATLALSVDNREVAADWAVIGARPRTEEITVDQHHACC